MALSQRTDWHRAYQNALGVTVYSEYDDGSVGTFGIRFADGTSQFTAASGSGSGGTDTVQQVSTNISQTIAASTNYFVQATAGAGGITITLPTAVGIAGQKVIIKKVDTAVGAVAIATTSAQTIDGTLFGTSYSLTNFMQYVVLESDNANWNIVGGN